LFWTKSVSTRNRKSPAKKKRGISVQAKKKSQKLQTTKPKCPAGSAKKKEGESRGGYWGVSHWEKEGRRRGVREHCIFVRGETELGKKTTMGQQQEKKEAGDEDPGREKKGVRKKKKNQGRVKCN